MDVKVKVFKDQLLEDRIASRRHYKENFRQPQKYVVQKIIKLKGKGFCKNIYISSSCFQRNREEVLSNLWELQDPTR